MGKRKRVIRIIFAVIVTVLILLLIVYINHQIHLKEEAELRLPLGKMVEVGGHNMSIYVEGSGDMTLVFMSGGGTCSPILDFRSLYSLLSNKYQIAVVEKFGYGFSDVVDKGRDIDSILEDTRAALAAAGLNAPYVLCPHSMSGLEALYWAQKYPDEVSAIIREKSLKSIWESPDSFKWNRNFDSSKLKGFCRECRYTERCLGGCSNSRYCINGSFESENRYCAYNVEMKKWKKYLESLNDISEIDNVIEKATALKHQDLYKIACEIKQSKL